MSDEPVSEQPVKTEPIVKQVTQYELAQWLFQRIEMGNGPCETPEACLALMGDCIAAVRNERQPQKQKPKTTTKVGRHGWTVLDRAP